MTNVLSCNVKGHRMQEQMNNVSEEMEILRKNQTEILEMKNTVLEMKNAFDKLISRQETTQERTSALKNMTIENSKSEKQGEKKTCIYKTPTEQHTQELWG